MKNIIVKDGIFEKLPGLVLLTGKVQVGKINHDAIKNYLNESWSKLGGKIGADGPKNHPLIHKWRETLRAAGTPVKDCPISIEAIAKRAARGGNAFSINPIVDTYNAISMDLVLPFGAYDTSEIEGNLQVRLSHGGESFSTLGSGETETTVSNEIVFADDKDILTRHFLWRQSEKAKISAQTNEYIFVCEILEDMGKEVLSNARNLITVKFNSLLGIDKVDIEEIRCD